MNRYPKAEYFTGRFEEVRRRTLDLASVVDWPTLRQQHVPILSPMVWDLGHIGHFEELWICQRLGGREPLDRTFLEMFDAVENPRPTRVALDLPDESGLYDYLREVRWATLQVLAGLEGRGGLEPGPAQIFEMILQHEEQHQETLLQAMQLLDASPYSPGQRRRLPPPDQSESEMISIPAGRFLMGLSTSAFCYDNERRQHERELRAYRIGRFPVSNGEYLRFVEAGGYQAPEYWSEPGWAHRQEAELEAPANWRRHSDGWAIRFMNRIEPLPPKLPVIHVSYFEAEAYARWAEKRLPIEGEWEKAALWDPATGDPRLYPWGDELPDPTLANVDQSAFQPAPIGSLPRGASAYGVEQMVGDVWEWTASEFLPYPGFEADPYPEYSEVFFGADYKVLRGGSWATRPHVARGPFRNWDFPIRRQIFAGFRLADDRV